MTETNHQSEQHYPILITGAAGLIGSRLLKLLSKECPVIGLDIVEPEQ